MTPEELLAGIRDGDAHFGGIRCLRLFRLERYSALGLRQEIDHLCAVEAPSDVSEVEHVTNWVGPQGAVRQYSLLNRSGDFADYASDHDFSCRGKRFHHRARYPRLAAFIDELVQAVNVRVNVLGCGASLAPHEEHSLFPSGSGSAAVRARFHLPIRSPRLARMQLEGEEHRFAPRTVYYFNQGCVHGASNGGRSPRVHLVWDQVLTRDVYDLMFGVGAAPDGWSRVHPDRQEMQPAQVRPLPPFTRLPPLVTRAESEALGFASIE